MSFADERRAIEGRLADNFTALPIAYENLPFAETQTMSGRTSRACS